jgi:hypothetical protein
MTITIPSHLSDDELTAEVFRCAREENGATARLVAHLAEFDARQLHLAAGYSSLFKYCCNVLGLSEHATYNRIEAARLARRFPVVLKRLERGSVNLTGLRMLAPHLTDANHEELLQEAAHRGRGEIEELLAKRFPRPDTPASVRKLPEHRTQPFADMATPAVPAPPAGAMPRVNDPAPETRSTAEPMPTRAPRVTQSRPLVTPLSTDRYEIRFTTNAATRDKLKLAQDLLRHCVPTGDPAEIFDRALTALIDQVARRKLAIVRKPQRTVRSTADGSRHIPSGVKRAVWVRDRGRCAFVGDAGRRCSERAFLEFHHVEPHAVGGKATVENIALRCRAHNAHEADAFYGTGRPADGSGTANDSPKERVSWGFHSF